MREVGIMLKLDHPGVVRCHPTPAGLDPGTPDLPTLTMEYCEAGDLRLVLLSIVLLWIRPYKE